MVLNHITSFFFNNWRAWEKTVSLSIKSRNHCGMKTLQSTTTESTESEAYIGFLASCAPEPFYDNGDFLLNSIHIGICHLQLTILQ